MLPQDLKDWRARLDMTQPEAAEALCISLQSVKAYEGGVNPIPDRIAKLAEYIERYDDIGPPPYAKAR